MDIGLVENAGGDGLDNWCDGCLQLLDPSVSGTTSSRLTNGFFGMDWTGWSVLRAACCVEGEEEEGNDAAVEGCYEGLVVEADGDLDKGFRAFWGWWEEEEGGW